MSSKVRELMASGFGELRHEPTAKRIQAVLGGATIVDSTRAVLVWEPRRIVPSYAVPVQDVRGELVPADAVSGRSRRRRRRRPGRRNRAAGARPADSVLRAQHRGRGGRPAGGGPGAAGCGLPPGRPGPGRAGDPRLRRLRRLVRGGRAERGPPARPVPPHRRAAQLPPGPAGAGRRGAGGQLPAGPAVRDHAADPLLPAAGGRDGRAGAQLHQDLVRLQGPGVVLLRVGRRADRSRHRLELPGSAARRGPGPRPDRVLRRADRRGAGRRAPGPAGHAVVGRPGEVTGGRGCRTSSRR